MSVDADRWPLPRTRHRPGSGTQPDHDLLDTVVAACPARTDAGNWMQNPTWLYGWRLLAAGYYWEAHEAWEPVWQRATPNSRERLLVQATIQLANALLKRRTGRDRAAVRLLDHAGRLLRELYGRGGGPSLMGVDVAALGRLITSLNA